VYVCLLCRGFDIGNHFCEWCYCYDYEEFPYYIARLEDYPSQQEQVSSDLLSFTGGLMPLVVSFTGGLMPLVVSCYRCPCDEWGLSSSYLLDVVRHMAYNPSSPSRLLVPKSRTTNLEAIVHVLFCASFCCQNAWQMCKITGTRFLVQYLGQKTWIMCHRP